MRSISRSLLVLTAAAAAIGCGDDDGGPSLPAAPAITSLTPAPTSVQIAFTGPTDATGFIVQRAPGGSITYTTVGTPATSPFTDSGLDPETEYVYRMATVRGTDTSAFTAAQPTTTLQLGAAGSVTLTGDITANRTLYRDTTYILSGFVKVTSGATLTIQSGTRIIGSTTQVGSALFILRGAQINAGGTADQPIVFTSGRTASNRKPGDWGGLIIIGNAQVNRAGPVILEGSDAPTIPNNDGGEDYAGGNAAGDAGTSGTLRYVRVEFGGYAVQQDQELNSFTLAAVGSGTTLEYLQSMSGLDDAFEWFGGTVNGRYLVSYESGDDHFDASEGYRGRNQFLIAYQSTVLQPLAGTGQVSSDPQGFEVDGCSGAGCTAPGAGTNAQSSNPYNMPVFANFTVIGTGDVAEAGSSGGVGMVLRRGTGGTYLNGIVARWPRRGVSVRDTTTWNRQAVDSLILRGILLAENAGGALDSSSTVIPITKMGTGGIDTTTSTAAQLVVTLPSTSEVPASAAAFNWSAAAAGPAASGGLATFDGVIAARNTGSFITPTAYRGAGDPANTAATRWWEGWTAYYQN